MSCELNYTTAYQRLPSTSAIDSHESKTLSAQAVTTDLGRPVSSVVLPPRVVGRNTGRRMGDLFEGFDAKTGVCEIQIYLECHSVLPMAEHQENIPIRKYFLLYSYV